MEPPKVLLKATGLSLGYGRRMILQAVDLSVSPGEFWFFLGPNGEGKTTLVRAILGALPPRSGRLWLDPELGRRERIGFVPQRCDINPTLPTTLGEFTTLGLVGIAAPAHERREPASLGLIVACGQARPQLVERDLEPSPHGPVGDSELARDLGAR